MGRRRAKPELSKRVVAASLLLLSAAPFAWAQGASGGVGAKPILVSASPLQVDLGTTLKLQIEGLDAAGQQTFDPTTFRLRLNGHQFQDLKPERTIQGELAFDLRKLRDDKDGGWLFLVGSPPITGLTPVTVGVTSSVIGDLPVMQDKVLSIDLQIFPIMRLALGIAVAGFIAIVVLLLGQKTDMLRDTAVLPQGVVKPYSLARCQMAWWFVLITACFIGISMITSNTSHIVTAQSLTLLGISSVTALGSAAINVAKSDASATSPPQAAQPQAQPLPAQQPPHQTSQPHVSFVRDLLTDGSDWAFHRVQILVWTVILGVVTLWSAYGKLSLPDFDFNLLILMGISSGLYLGFKWPE